jgi:hypothetical protein
MALQYLLHDHQQGLVKSAAEGEGRALLMSYLDRLDATEATAGFDHLASQAARVEDALRGLSESDLTTMVGELSSRTRDSYRR